jgi:hypothetical protein
VVSNPPDQRKTTGIQFEPQSRSTATGLVVCRTWPIQISVPVRVRISAVSSPPGNRATGIGSAVNLRWTLSDGAGRAISLSYSSAADILVVNYDGYLRRRYGCRSAGLPAFAQAAC